MKIAVVGAGISGLTFAAAMRRFSPEAQVDVYERERDDDGRSQGYSLGLKGDAGLAVLKTLGLYERIAGGTVPITNFVFCSQRGRPLLELLSTGDEKRLTQRIQRRVLKATLREALDGTPLHFGMRCTGYEHGGDGVELLFETGERVRADYLIACDGVASAIRQQMIGDEKRYLGLTAIVGEAPLAIQHPLLRGGYFMTLGDDGSSVFCYRQPDGIHLSYTVHAAEGAPDGHDPSAFLQRVQQATKTWHQPIPDIVAAIDPASVVVRGYYDKDPIKRVREGRIWLIGDAAHPMCPFQGQGANMGMVDGLKFAQYFADMATNPDSSDLAAQATALEADIVGRGRKAVLGSRNAARQFHVTSRLQQRFRNVGFRVGNTAIKLFSKRKSA